MEGFAKLEGILGSVPWIIVGFFVNKLIHRIEVQSDAVAEMHTKQEVLFAAINMDAVANKQAHMDLGLEIQKLHQMEEVLRARTHLLLGKLAAMKMKLEMQGVKFPEQVWNFKDSREKAGDDS